MSAGELTHICISTWHKIQELRVQTPKGKVPEGDETKMLAYQRQRNTLGVVECSLKKGSECKNYYFESYPGLTDSMLTVTLLYE